MFKIIRLMIMVMALSSVLVLAGFTNSDLPPRPTPAPTPVSTVAEVPALNGEKIQLQIDNAVEEIPGNLWTIVEWQDTNTGVWHEVDGWRGTLNTSTTQTWWVGSELFGNGPFRWQLYAGEDGELVTTSAAFDLPSGTGLMVVVNVTLD